MQYLVRTFFSIVKLEKREFYSLYYNAIFKDSILFRWTGSSFEIDATVVKKHVFLKFLWKICKVKVKKES